MRLSVKIFLLLFVGITTMLSVVPAAQAQSGLACDIQYQFFGLLDTLIPGTHRCDHIITYLSYCYIRNNSCRPDPIEACARTVIGGNPICLLTGNTFINESDVRLPGLGGGLELSRIWNSQWPASQSTYQNTGMFGPNWRSTYEEQVFVPADGYLRYSRSDGSFWSFGYQGSTNGSGGTTYTYTTVAPANVPATLSVQYNASSPAACVSWTLAFQSGEKRVFSCPGSPTSGKLQSIVDRNGNTTSLTYDAGNRLSTVTDPAGRHLNFTYGTGPTYYSVTGVTGDTGAGISVTYAYDTNTTPRLIKVTKADNTFVTFNYDANSMITSVTDTDGKLLESHTYDTANRGLSSSRAINVDSLNLTYPSQ